MLAAAASSFALGRVKAHTNGRHWDKGPDSSKGILLDLNGIQAWYNLVAHEHLSQPVDCVTRPPQ